MVHEVQEDEETTPKWQPRKDLLLDIDQLSKTQPLPMKIYCY